MSEQPQTAETEQQGEPVATDKPLGENGEKALKAERETRKNLERQLADAQQVIKAAESAALSDLERAQQEATEAKTLLEAARRESLISKVALDKSLPADLVQFLTGADEDALQAQADLLVERLSKAPAKPKPDPSQGGQSNQSTKSNADAFAAFLGDRL